MALLDILNQADYLDGGEDSRVWMPPRMDLFTWLYQIRPHALAPCTAFGR